MLFKAAINLLKSSGIGSEDEEDLRRLVQNL